MAGPVISPLRKFKLPLAELATVGLRVAAGAAGALPPLIALLMLDHAAYGHAMANMAIALLVIGPIEQFLGQGYLRGLVARGTESGRPRPDGAACVPAYVLVCVMLLTIVGPAVDLRGIDLIQIATLVVIVSICRVQENWFVASGQPSVAIVLFYLVPPLAVGAFVLGARFVSHFDDFTIMAAALITSYAGCAVVSFLVQSAEGRRLLIPHVPLTSAAWRDEVLAAWPSIISGALSSAIEQLPIVMLRLFGFAATIPSFEIARKIASVPNVIVHALNIQLGTNLMRNAHMGEFDAFRAGVRRLRWFTAGTALIYFPAAAIGLWIAAKWIPGFAGRIDLPLTFTVFCVYAIPTVTATAGFLLVALRGEAWWTFAAFVSLIVMLAAAFGTLGSLGRLAIPIAMLAQSVVMNAVRVYGASKVWRATVASHANHTTVAAPLVNASSGA